MRVRRWAAGLAACAAMALSGCSADPGHPATLPTLMPAPTPTPSTTATTSDLEAATQVVRRYYALLNRLATSMDADGIAALMTRDCPCRQQVAAIEAARSKGQHYVDHVEIVSLTPLRDTASQVSILVEYDAGRGGLVDAKGRVVTTAKPRRGVKRLFRVTLVMNRWLIADIGTA